MPLPAAASPVDDGPHHDGQADPLSAGLAAGLAGCAAGDTAAFEALFDLAAPALWRALRLRGAGPELAEQLLEAVCWRAWREAGRFDPATGPAAAWLLGLVQAEWDAALRGPQAAAG